MLIGELLSLMDKSSFFTLYSESSSVWICICLRLWSLRLCERLKPLPQMSQPYGLSPVWSLKWFFRLEALVKLFSHCGQSYFSPEWIFSCSLRRPDWLKLRSHIEQWYGLSPVCVSRCLFMAPEWAKLFPQSGQEKGFSPVWTFWWPLSWPFWVNCFPHRLHW